MTGRLDEIETGGDLVELETRGELREIGTGGDLAPIRETRGRLEPDAEITASLESSE